MSIYKINNSDGISLNDISGNVGIGTTNSTAKLTVSGSIKFDTGNHGADKLLISDENGNADWVSFGVISGVVGGTGSTDYAIKWTDGPNSTIGNSSWAYSGNSYYPVTDGSNIGLSVSRIGTIFMSSILDFNSTLIFKESGTEISKFENGSLGIGTSPTSSAILDLYSTDKGFAKPRMSSTQRDNILLPVTGLEIYNTTSGLPNYYDGSSWKSVNSQPITRYVYLVSDVSDQSSMGGTISHVYNTFQSAYDAANSLQISLGGSENVILNIGVITSAISGDLVLNSDWNDNVVLVGFSKSVSVLGNIIATNTSNGYDINISSRSVTIGNIDTSSISSGDGGNVTISGDITIGNVTANALGSGNGGSIVIGSVKQGVITIGNVLTTGADTGSGGDIIINGSETSNLQTIGGSTGISGDIIINDSKINTIISTNNSSSVGGIMSLDGSTISDISYNINSSGSGGVISIKNIQSSGINIIRSNSGLFGSITISYSNIYGDVNLLLSSSATGLDVNIPNIINTNISGTVDITNLSSSSGSVGLLSKEVGMGNFSYVNHSTGTSSNLSFYDTDISTSFIAGLTVSGAKTPSIFISSGSNIGPVYLNTTTGGIGTFTINGSNVSSINVISNTSTSFSLISNNSIVSSVTGSLTVGSFIVTSDNSKVIIDDMQAPIVSFSDINCDMSYHIGSDLGILSSIVVNSKSSKWDLTQGNGYTSSSYDLTLFDAVISDSSIPFTQNVLIKSEGSYIHSISSLGSNSKINRTSIGTVNSPFIGVDNISGTGIQFDYCTIKGTTYSLNTGVTVSVSQKFCVNDGVTSPNINLI